MTKHYAIFRVLLDSGDVRRVLDIDKDCGSEWGWDTEAEALEYLRAQFAADDRYRERLVLPVYTPGEWR